MADEQEEELILDNPIKDQADEGAEAEAASAEPIDEEEFPDTLDDETGEEVQNKGLLKLLRDQLKEKTRRISELETRGSQPKLERTKEPDLWDDCEGDPDKYKIALLAWQENERRITEHERNQDAAQSQVRETWQSELNTYKTNAQKLGKPDFDDAESAVIGALTEAQQTTIVMAAKDPARFIYALGRSPNRLAELAQITNPIKLAATVARIEGSRTMPRKEPANIDSPVRGSARLSQPQEDATEKRLEKEAERSKDYTELFRYRKEKRAKEARAA